MDEGWKRRGGGEGRGRVGRGEERWGREVKGRRWTRGEVEEVGGGGEFTHVWLKRVYS